MALRPPLTKALSRFTEAMVSGSRFSGSYDHARLLSRQRRAGVRREVDPVDVRHVADVEEGPLPALGVVGSRKLGPAGAAVVDRRAAAVRQPAVDRLRLEVEEAGPVGHRRVQAEVGLDAGDVRRQEEHGVRREVEHLQPEVDEELPEEVARGEPEAPREVRSEDHPLVAARRGRNLAGVRHPARHQVGRRNPAEGPKLLHRGFGDVGPRPHRAGRDVRHLLGGIGGGECALLVDGVWRRFTLLGVAAARAGESGTYGGRREARRAQRRRRRRQGCWELEAAQVGKDSARPGCAHLNEEG